MRLNRPNLLFQPGSFRDPSCRVFEWQGEICRALDATAAGHHHSLFSLAFFQDALERGDVISTAHAPDLRGLVESLGFEAVVRHDRVPLLSWPWEWSFSMLRDAALLHLRLMQQALAAGWILCDATPFNIQFVGSRPVHIDTGSFVPLVNGGIWEGYRQFCQQFLYPLMLQSWKGVDFQPWLRGRLEGITPEQFSGLMSLRDFFRRGAFSHVWLHARLSSRAAAQEPIRRSLESAGFNAQMILQNVRGLERIVRRLQPKFPHSAWVDYSSVEPHVSSDLPMKSAFVLAACEKLRPRLSWDLGCNEGHYSRIAAEFGTVAALDADQPTIDRLFLRLQGEKHPFSGRILPLLHQVADPAPGQGWRGRERAGFDERSQPQLILALAVLHHLVITCGLRLDDIIDWLHERGAHVVLEWVGREDPLVQRLLLNRRDVFSDFHQDALLQAFAGRFNVIRSQQLPSSSRCLYLLEPILGIAGS